MEENFPDRQTNQGPQGNKDRDEDSSGQIEHRGLSDKSERQVVDPYATKQDNSPVLPLRSGLPANKTAEVQPPTPTLAPKQPTAEDIYHIPQTPLKGKYEFLKVIGAGGAGVIYKARQIPLGRHVAVKMIHSHLISVTALKRFQKEAKTVSNVSHPNIISIHDFGISEENQPYMVMDYIEGMALSEYIKENGPLTQDLAKAIAIQICDGLAHAHSKGILHRDLKPNNIMIVTLETCELHAKVLDFGLAKMLLEDEDESEHLTRTGETVGTPAFMSPEQVMGKDLDHRADIYSLGCVLYHCLTGAPPFIGNTKMETMLMHLNNAPLPVNEKMEETVIEPAFDRIVMKLLEKKQADRFQSMSEVKASLQGSAENIFLPAETQADQAQSSEAGKKAPAKKSAPPTRMILLASASVATILFSTGLLTAYFIQNNQSNRVADTIGSVRQKVDDLSDKIYEPDITFQGTIGRDVSRKHPIIDSDGLSITDEALTHLSEAQGIGLLTLILKDSPVTGKGMSYLADLKIPIASLDLTNTRVDNQAMEQIARIRPLKSLNLTGLKLNDSGMQALAASPSLIDLDLTGNDIGDDGLARLALLTTLQKLNLKANGVSDAGIVYLKKLKNLTDLDLSGCAITDQAVKEIAGLKTIEKLSLDGTKISRASLKNLARMPNLIILDLSDTNLDDLKSADLLQFKRLQKLRLHNIDLKSEEVLSFQRLNPSCSIRFE